MANFDTMVTTIQRYVGNHPLATTAIVGEFVNKQHSDLLESYNWSRRKQEIIVNTAADKTAGTVAVTQGSGTITGTGTSFASGDVNRAFLIEKQLFAVNTFTSTTEISLGDVNGTAVTYPGSTATGQSYTIFTRFYPLTAGVEQVLYVVYDNPLRKISQEWLEWKDPNRETTGSAPTHYAFGPRDQSGTNDLIRLEFWPRTSAPVSIRVGVQLGHTDLSGTTNPIVPSQPIEWLAAEQTCYYLHAKTEDSKWLNLATVFNGKGLTTLEMVKNEDAKKFSTIDQVQDKEGGLQLSATDFGIDHDVR